MRRFRSGEAGAAFVEHAGADIRDTPAGTSTEYRRKHQRNTGRRKRVQGGRPLPDRCLRRACSAVAARPLPCDPEFGMRGCADVVK
ncbi:hypothetical protein BTO02_07720 [Paraburkholderia sp. SOS3]|nr:hypothetical protein BTO02_07720 [Paraburkholderia sp. SOS3]